MKKRISPVIVKEPEDDSTKVAVVPNSVPKVPPMMLMMIPSVNMRIRMFLLENQVP